MNIISIIFLSIGLAMDCFAVSITKGLSVDIHHIFAKRQRPWLMAVLFGLFQGVMPLIGYFAGVSFSTFFSRFSPWIALVLLGYIGGKMIWESLQDNRKNAPDSKEDISDFSLRTLLGLAIATSIDALATGVLFIPCPDSIWIGVSVIALGSFLFSMMGYLIGVFVGKVKVNVELIGGLILVGIGLKIWIQGCF